MPVLRINAVGDRPDPGAPDLVRGVRDALGGTATGGPIIVMIHGYKYAPGDPDRCPHRSILSETSAVTARRCLSWPRAMGYGDGPGDGSGDGLCIAFGWQATGTIWQAARSADLAAEALGQVLTILAGLTKRPVHLLAHSLGARVALGALQSLPARTVGRMVLLHGAEFRSRALSALASPAGRTAELINVTTRENDLFDALFRSFLAPHRPLDPALSAGLGVHRPNWLDMRIDDPGTRAALDALGFPIPPPQGRVCHWSAYMRDGMFDLHRALLRAPGHLPLTTLKRALPDGARRGVLDRTFARPVLPPLPRGAETPS